MTLLHADELKAILEQTDQPCVSIYLPTTQPGQDAHQNLIRLKNSLAAVEAQLGQRGWTSQQINDFLQPLHQHLPETDTEFWKHQAGDVAVFLAPDFYRFYTLPLAFEPLTVVAERFYIKPLLPLYQETAPIYILAIAQNSLRLLQYGRGQVDSLKIPDELTSLAAALRFDDPEAQLQLHSSQAGGSAPIYHGQGVSGTDDKTELRRWFQKLDAAICDRLHAQPGPLVLAGVEYLTVLYRECSNYSDILSESILGNPEATSAAELGERARTLLQPRQQQQYEATVERYRELLGTGQATADVRTAIAAADRGQVDTLLIPRDRQLWGRLAPDDGQIVLDVPATEPRLDLANFAAIRTLLQGGTVLAVEPEAMPDRAAAAAILRYPIIAGQPLASTAPTA